MHFFIAVNKSFNLIKSNLTPSAASNNCRTWVSPFPYPIVIQFTNSCTIIANSLLFHLQSISPSLCQSLQEFCSWERCEHRGRQHFQNITQNLKQPQPESPLGSKTKYTGPEQYHESSASDCPNYIGQRWDCAKWNCGPRGWNSIL